MPASGFVLELVATAANTIPCTFGGRTNKIPSAGMAPTPIEGDCLFEDMGPRLERFGRLLRADEG